MKVLDNYETNLLVLWFTKGELLYSSVGIVKLIHGTDFVPQGKCTIFWLNRGLRVYLDFYVSDFPKSISKYFLYPSTFYSKTPYSGGMFG